MVLKCSRWNFDESRQSVLYRQFKLRIKTRKLQVTEKHLAVYSHFSASAAGEWQDFINIKETADLLGIPYSILHARFCNSHKSRHEAHTEQQFLSPSLEKGSHQMDHSTWLNRPASL